MGAGGVLSHTIDRPRCTDRQLLGDETLLSSYHFLRATQGPCRQGIPAPDPVPAFIWPSRRPNMTVIPSEWNESRDLQPGIAAISDSGGLPWGRPHEGISVLWETTFVFQRAKPIVVSPFENPFPTRGPGPWTPRGDWGQAGVLSHTIDRFRCTDRQLLGDETLLSSYHFLRATQGPCRQGIPAPDPVPAFIWPSRRPNMTVIPSEWNESRDLQPGIAAISDSGGLPWGRPHEGISVLWETTFVFQRAKPIVVSPFENPFPTRGCGPWTPRGDWGQAGVLSHTIDRFRCTDRQLLGDETLLSSYHFLRATQGPCRQGIPAPDPVPAFIWPSRRPNMTVIPSEWNESRDLQPGIAAISDSGGLPWGRPHEGISVLWETTFVFQRAKPIVVSPFENPFPTRGCGPWTPRGDWGQAGCFRIPSTGFDAPTASCSVLPFCWHRMTFWGQGRVLFSLAVEVPGWRSLQSLPMAAPSG